MNWLDFERRIALAVSVPCNPRASAFDTDKDFMNDARSI